MTNVESFFNAPFGHFRYSCNYILIPLNLEIIFNLSYRRLQADLKETYFDFINKKITMTSLYMTILANI